MQTSTFFHPFASPTPPFSGSFHRIKKPINRQNRLITMSFTNDGKMVDENMIVLRERIRKVKADTECDDDKLPDNWMKWEKAYVCSGGYYSDVYDGIAVLQRFLMESRPSVALGLVAVFAFGGSTAAMTVLQWLINSVQGIGIN